MIFEFLLILFFSVFGFSSIAVSAFHLSQFLGVLPVTDLAILLGASTNIVRQFISLTFFVMSLSGFGLACCTFTFVLCKSSNVRELDSIIRYLRTVKLRMEERRYPTLDEAPLPTKLQPFAKHRRRANILSVVDLIRLL